MPDLMINPAFSLTAGDLELLNDDQFARLLGATDRLRTLLNAETARRQAAERAKWEVLGRDATVTCLAHRRVCRWMAAPCWWYHESLLDSRPAEARQCHPLRDLTSPIVITRKPEASDA